MIWGDTMGMTKMIISTRWGKIYGTYLGRLYHRGFVDGKSQWWERRPSGCFVFIFVQFRSHTEG
jgi:hypothetical protein